MILNIVYLTIGIIMGFLVKNEIDIKCRTKRMEKKVKMVSNMDIEPYNKTLEMIKDLNASLINIQGYQNTKKKEV